MDAKHRTIDNIIKGEWEMFVSVNDGAHADSITESRPSCRDYPDEFKLHRESKLISWSQKTLSSYLDDIVQARKTGRNLMTYKYARMDNLIPCENNSPFINTIATAMLNWQKAFIDKYPGIMSGGRTLAGGKPGVDWPSFDNYLRCELESYSDKTLECLASDIETLKKEGKSMSEMIYLYLIRKKGYDSLDQAEMKNR
jgi:hypothetical protein